MYPIKQQLLARETDTGRNSQVIDNSRTFLTAKETTIW